MTQSWMRDEIPHNPKEPRLNRDEKLKENPSSKLVKPMQEHVKLITETSSKGRKPKTYDDVMNDPLHCKSRSTSKLLAGLF